MRALARLTTLAALAALVLVPTPGRAAAFRLVDGLGRDVGPVVSLSQGLARVLLEASGRTITLQFGRDGVVPDDTEMALFASNDCSGPPLVRDLGSVLPSGGQPIGPAIAITPADTVLVADPGLPVLTAIDSRWEPADGPPCNAGFGNNVAVRSGTLILELASLPPPFSLRAVDGPATGAAARGPARAVIAVDGDGEPVGDVGHGEELPLAATVVLRDGALTYPVFLLADRAVAGSALIAFATNNCTGPAVVWRPLNIQGLYAPAGVAPDGKILVAAGPAPDQNVGSVWAPTLSPTGCQVSAAVGQTVSAPAVLVDLAARPLPFALTTVQDPPGSRSTRRRGLTVVDAAGLVVGPAFVTSGFPVLAGADVVIREGRRLGILVVPGPGTMEGTDVARYESLDCTGPVAIRVANPPGPRALYPPTALGPGPVLHTGDGALEIATLQSWWDLETLTCLADPPAAVFVRRTSVLADLSGLTLPFGVR